jgi:hypothetical protein
LQISRREMFKFEWHFLNFKFLKNMLARKNSENFSEKTMQYKNTKNDLKKKLNKKSERKITRFSQVQNLQCQQVPV